MTAEYNVKNAGEFAHRFLIELRMTFGFPAEIIPLNDNCVRISINGKIPKAMLDKYVTDRKNI